MSLLRAGRASWRSTYSAVRTVARKSGEVSSNVQLRGGVPGRTDQSPHDRPCRSRCCGSRAGTRRWTASPRPTGTRNRSLPRWSVADLEGFWQAVADFFGFGHMRHERVLGARDAGRRVVPRRAAQLRRAHARRDDADDVAVVARSQTREPIELTSASCASRSRARAPGCSGSAWPRATASSPTCRTSRRRSSRSWRRRASGAIWASVVARVRPAQRDRPLRADRAEGAARRRRLHATAARASTARAEVAAIRAGAADARARVDVGYGDDATAGTRCRASRARSRSSRCRSTTRSTCSSPPARPGCRRRSCTATAASSLEHFKNLGLTLGHPARRAAAVVHDDRLDDVERARLRAAAARSIVMLDGDPAWPDLGQLWRLAEETEADASMGVSPGVPDGLPQGRVCSRAATSTSRASASSPTAGSPLPARGLRLRLRAARPGHAAGQRQRRHRRLQRDRLRLPAAARRTAARSPAAASASTPRRSTSTAARWSASSASW